jgi:hypothetical protein
MAVLLRIFAIAVLVTPALAQTSRGSVAGTVTDSSGAVIVGAEVRLTHNETGVMRSGRTNEVGIYRFDAVDLGTFDVQISKPGFATFDSQGVPVEGNRTTAVDAKLQVGENKTVVQVNGTAEELLLKDSPLRGGNFQGPEVSQLPLNGLNPISLAGTLPGAISPSGSTVYGNGGTATQFAVNGQRPRGNSYLLDGTDNNDMEFTGPTQGFNIADAVQEVSVQTSNFGAEFGRAGGAVVNVITKSGTNQFSGTGLWRFGSQAFNSLSNLQKLSPTPPHGFSENIYGFTLGGPIQKNKTFFFAAMQQDRFHSNSQFPFVLPTADAVSILRSQFTSNPRLELYLGAMGDLRGSFSPFSTWSLGADPATGRDRGTVTFGTANWLTPTTSDETQAMLRLDHSWSQRHEMSFRYLYDSSKQSPAQLPQPPTFPGYFGDAANTDHNFLLSDSFALATTLTNELRFSYARVASDWPISPRAVPLAEVLPAVVLQNSPIAAPGIGGGLPQFEFANNWLLQETQSKLMGRHTFRYGFEFFWQFAKQLGAGFAGRGQVAYTTSSGFSVFANFLDDYSGPSGIIRRNFGDPVSYPNSFRQSYFFQDTWKAAPTLSVNLGVRYENFGQPANSLRFPAFAGFDPSEFLVENKVNPYNMNLGPAAGVAWSPSSSSGGISRILGGGKAVWRAGYQISYDTFFTQMLNFIMGDSPNTVQTNKTSLFAGGRGTANWSSQMPTMAPAPTIQDGQLAVFDKNIRNPYTEHWNFGLQRVLPQKLLFDLAYVGSESHHLFIRDDVNPRQLNGARLHPEFGPRIIRSSNGNSVYHALQVQVERRFIERFYVNGSYTWSRFLDSTSESLLVNANSEALNLTSIPAILGGLKLDRGLSDYHRSHRLTVAYIWDIPSPEVGLRGSMLGHWSISGITTFQSGTPYTVQNGLDRNNDGNANDRPDIGNPSAPFDTRGQITPGSGPGSCSTGYVNPDTGGCVTPADVHFIEGLGLPNSHTVGRNTLFAGGTNNWDVTLAKVFPIREKKRLEFRWEAFNVFNHRQFVHAPSRDVLNSPTGQFLNLKLTDGGIRSMRIQLKFLF